MRRKLQANFKEVRNRIADACARANREPESVRLVAVTKSVGMDVIRTLVDMGVTDFGENRVQELTQRAAMVAEMLKRRQMDPSIEPVTPPSWHMIGSLQRNKVRSLLPWVKMVHSVDRLRLAETLSKHAGSESRDVDVLLEVNGGNEPQKNGMAVCAAPHLAEQIVSLPNIRVRGLMSMAPLGADQTQLRNVFDRVRDLFDEMRSNYAVGGEFDTLSMGMSDDFELAVECGATLVRVGTALFSGLEVRA